MIFACGVLASSPQFRQVVGLTLRGGQIIRKVRDDPSGQGDVAGLHGNAGAAREGLHNRQQGIGRQCGRLIGQRIDDLGGGHFNSGLVLRETAD